MLMSKSVIQVCPRSGDEEVSTQPAPSNFPNLSKVQIFDEFALTEDSSPWASTAFPCALIPSSAIE